MGDRDVLKELLGALVDVEHAQLQVEDGFASSTKKEMARLDNPRVHRPHRYLEHTFTLDLAKLVPSACKGGKCRSQIEILPQRMHIGPIVMQHAASGIGVTEQFDAE